MNLAMTYTMDALRNLELDLRTLEGDEKRLAVRRSNLDIRKKALLAQLEYLKANPAE